MCYKAVLAICRGWSIVYFCFFFFVCFFFVFCFLMIRRPPRSTLDRSSAASDVYKRQALRGWWRRRRTGRDVSCFSGDPSGRFSRSSHGPWARAAGTVSYTHLRAHETVLDLVCRLLLEKKNTEHDIQVDNGQTPITLQHGQLSDSIKTVQ